jgi:autotransporter-associated beta strand protein/YD repeat-containing protein
VAVEPLEDRTLFTATPLYWDPSGAATASGGSGTWNTTTAEWRSGSATGSLVAWNNSGDANGPFQAVFSAGSGTVTIATPVTASQVAFNSSGYNVSGVNTSSGILTLSTNQQVSVASGDTATISAIIAGSAGLTKTGAGTLILAGSNTYTTQTLLSAGTIQLNGQLSGYATLGATSNTLNISGGMLDINGVSPTIGILTGTSGSIVNNGAAATFTISGAGGAATYSGNIANGSGQLSLIVTGSARLYGTDSYSGTTTITSVATLYVTKSTGSGVFVDNGTFYPYAPTGPDVFSNNISGSGQVVIAGLKTNSTVTLSGSDTYTGGTNISSAWLILGSSNAMGATSGPLTISGTTANAGLDLNGFSVTVGTLYGIDYYQSIRDGTTTSTAPATLTITAGGTLCFLQNSNGELSIATSVGGTLNMLALYSSADNSSDFLAPITVGSGTTLAGEYFDQALTDNGTLEINNPLLGYTTTPGVITGSGGVTSAGSGSAVLLTAADTYTGSTTIQSGSTELGSHLLASNITVNSSGTLEAATGVTSAGTTGSVTVNTGGIFVPECAGTSGYSSPTTISTGNLSLAAGSNFDDVINSSTAGSGYGQVNVTGTVSLNGAYLNLTGTRTNHDGDQIVLINNDGTDAVTGTFNNLPEGSAVVVNGVTYVLSYHGGTGNDVVLTNATPPSTANQTYDVVENVTQSQNAAQGVLSTDSDYNGEALSVYSVNGSTSAVNQAITTSHGSLTLNSNGSFTYVPQHDFVGTDSVTYIASDGVEQSASTTVQFVISAGALHATAAPITAVESQSTGTITVAHFTDDSGGEVGNYTASINWGDGQTTGGTVSSDGSGGWNVNASHTFSSHGTFTVTATISTNQGATTTVQTTATVSPSVLTVTGGLTINASPAMNSGSQLLAIFTVPVSADSPSDFSASINYGDGSNAAAGTIAFNANTDAFTVSGSHNYANRGTYTITITVSHGGVATSPVTSTALVSGYTINGDAGNNAFYIRLYHDTVQFFDNTPNLNVPTWTVSQENLGNVVVNGGSSNNTLTVDFSGGNPLPNGLQFTGGSSSVIGANQLIVIGLAASDSLNVNSSSITWTPATGSAAAISYTNANVEVSAAVGTVNITGGSASIQTTALGTDTAESDPGLVLNVTPAVTGSTATATVQSGQRLQSLTIGNGGSVVVAEAGGAALVLDSLTIAATGTLDLTNNDLIVRNGNLSDITALVTSGYNPNVYYNWNGTGITSSAAATDPSYLSALGVASNEDASGNPLYGSGAPLGLFDGQNPSTSDVLVRYTYYGDANLNGAVDGTDLSLIDNGSDNGLSGWYNGDFNYDGNVDGSDYDLINKAYNDQGIPFTLSTSSPIEGQALDLTPPASSASGVSQYSIDWGDGTANEIVSASATANVAHTYYTEPAEYPIVVEALNQTGGVVQAYPPAWINVLPSDADVTDVNLQYSSTGSHSYYVMESADHSSVLFYSASSPTTTPYQTVPISALRSINIGSSPLDSLTVDYSNGDPLSAAGLSFGGGSLTIVGTSGNDTLVVGTQHTSFTGSSFPLQASEIRYAKGTQVYFTGSAGENTLDADGGLCTVLSDPILANGQLSISAEDGGSVLLSTTSHLQALNIGSGGTVRMLPAGNNVLVTQSLSITAPTTDAPGGVLDLADNDMVVMNCSLAAITALLASGYNNGGWDGTGIVSTIAAHDLAGIESLGVGLLTGTFDGQSVTNSDVVVKFTYYGDINLNGDLDALDTPTQTTGWQAGDFNYDGVIDSEDVALATRAWSLVGTDAPNGPLTLVTGASYNTSGFTLPTTTPTGIPIFKWLVDWGNGSPAEPMDLDQINAAIPYSAAGTYQAVFTALDEPNDVLYRYAHVNITVSGTVNFSGAASDLTATANIDGTVNLRWIATGAGYSGFVIERKAADDAGFTQIATVSTDDSIYKDTTALPDTAYTYEVFAGSAAEDANPASASVITPDANATYGNLVETVAVPFYSADNSIPTIVSTVPLIAGEHYEFIATGQIIYRYQSSTEQQLADAEYGNLTTQPTFSDALSPVNFGIGINDTVNNANKYPYWGPPATDPNDTYIISYTPTVSGTIQFSYHDSYYNDNEAEANPNNLLKVQIWAETAAQIIVSPIPVTPVQGIPLPSTEIATFNNVIVGGTASDYSAHINWGDNWISTAVITADPNVAGQFIVSTTSYDTHYYGYNSTDDSSLGDKTITITVTCSSADLAGQGSEIVDVGVSDKLTAPVLTATANQAEGIIELTWSDSDPTTELAGYQLERATTNDSSSVWTVIGDGFGNAVSFVDNNAVVGQVYYYRIYARDFVGFVSPYSNIAWAVLTTDQLTITSTPGNNYTLPAPSNTALGEVDVTGNTDPNITNSVEFQQIQGQVQRQVNVAVPDAAGREKVDIFLLLDDTGSMAEVGPELAQQFPYIIEDLRKEYPNVDFGVGVGRMAEYDAIVGYGSTTTRESAFILDQPIVALGPTDFIDPLAAQNDPSPVERAILDALTRAPLPSATGYAEVSAIEALYQVATGAGFDQQGNQSTTSDGVAGSAEAEDAVGPTISADGPANEDDIPAFNTFQTGAPVYAAPATAIAETNTGIDSIVATIHATSSTVASQITASVTWPDGEVDFVTETGSGNNEQDSGGGVSITEVDNTFYVHETHESLAETQAGTYPLRVEIDVPGSGPIDVTSDLVVQPAPLDDNGDPHTGAFPFLSVLTPIASPNVAFSGVVANFNYTGAYGQLSASDFTATISWGDGQTSSGTIVSGGVNGGFDVQGIHTYSTISASDAALFSVEVTTSPTAEISLSQTNIASSPVVVPTLASALLPPAGTLGGAGFRAGALPIILMATDSPLVAIFPYATDINIVGQPADSGPVSEPVSAFEAGLTYEQPISGDSAPYEILQDEPVDTAYPTSDDSLPPGTVRAAGIQETVDALNSLGAKVIGLGANGAYDTDPAYNLNVETPHDQAPRSYMDALAALTGADNDTPETLSNGTDGGIQPGDPLFYEITNDSAGIISSGVQAAIGDVLAGEQTYNVSMITAGAGVTVTNNSGAQDDIPPGNTANFNISLGSTSSLASSDILFVDQSTGRLFASVPVRVAAPYQYTLTANDTLGLPVTFSLVNATAPAEADGNVGVEIVGDLLTFSPLTPGAYTFTVEATDGSLQAYQQFTVNVTEQTPTNPQPQISSISNQIAIINENLSFTVSATDTANIPLTYYLYGAPAGMTIDTATGVVNWTALQQQIGTYQVTAVVIDGQGDRGLYTFDVVAATANPAQDHAPVITSQQPGVAPVGDFFQYQIQAIDPNGNPFTFQLATNPDGSTQTLPAGMTFDPASGDITWIPDDDQVGHYSIYIQAVDSLGATTAFTVHINVDPVPATPTDFIIDQNYDLDATHGDFYATWNSDPNVAGYNIYLSRLDVGQSGVYTPQLKLNSSLITNTLIDLTQLDDDADIDQSYGFVLTAVNAQGLESAPTPVTIPVRYSLQSIILTVNAVLLNSDEVELSTSDTLGAYTQSFTWKEELGSSTIATLYSNTSSLVVTVTTAGNYIFNVSAFASNIYGSGTSLPGTVSIDVPAVPTRISVELGSNESATAFTSVMPGGSFNLADANVTVYDQFGNVIQSPPAITWSMYQSSSGATLQADGAYTAGSAAGTDIIEATSGNATGYFWVFVGDGSENPISAVGLKVSGTEGVTFGPVPIAEFVDSRSGLNASNYSASIDWGDGDTDDTSTLIVLTDGVYEVLGSHTYVHDNVINSDGTYNPYTITITISSNGVTSGVATTQPTIQGASYIAIPNPALTVPAQNTTSLPLLNVIDSDSVYDYNFNAFVQWPMAYNSNNSTYIMSGVWNPISVSVEGGVKEDTLVFNDTVGPSMFPYAGFSQIIVDLYKDGDDALDSNGNPTGYLLASYTIPLQISTTGIAVSNLTATPISSSTVELKWNVSPPFGYRIERTSANQPWNSTSNPPVWLQADNDYTTSDPYYDTGLLPDATYQYEVFPVQQDGSLWKGALSQPVTTWTTYTPANVTNATATETYASSIPGGPGSIGVQLYWDPETSDPNIVGYDVQRFNSSTNTWDSLLNNNYVDPTGPLFDGQLGYFDSSANFSNGVDSYQYRIVAVSNVINSGSPAVSTGTDVVAVLNALPPSMPTNVVATSYPDAIQLTWDDRPKSDDGNWAGWDVYRYDNASGNWDLLTLTPVSQFTGYNDYTAPFGVLIRYRVTSVSPEGFQSAPVEVDKMRSTDAEPAVPGDFTALAETIEPNNTLGIHLNWAAVVAASNDSHALDGTVAYNIYRSLTSPFTPNDATGGNLIATITGSGGNPPGTSYDDQAVSASTTYYYAVIAVDGDGDQSNPAFASAMSGSGISLRTPDVSSSNIDLAAATISWTSVANAAGYQVYRQNAAGGPFQLVSGSSLITQLSFQDDGLSPNSSYHYQVYAVDAYGNASDPAGTISVNTPAVTQTETISWQEVQYAIGFEVYRQDGGSGPYNNTSGLITALSYQDTGLSLGGSYNYKVFSVDENGNLAQVLPITVTSSQATPPIVVIVSPASTGNNPLVVSSDTPVQGIVDDLDNDLASWKLVLRPYSAATNITGDTPADDAQDIIVSQGTTQQGQLPQTPALLGSIDPTTIPNGLYQLILFATDQQGQQASPDELSYPLQIQSQLKLGNLTLPFTDLTINVPGGNPVTVTRTYDSSQAGVLGELGYGWTLNLANTQLRTTAAANPGGDRYAALSDGDLVYITLPDGSQYTFEFLAQPASNEEDNSLIGSVDSYTPQFVCVDGSGSKLTVPGDASDVLYQQTDGGFTDEAGNNYNPASDSSEQYLLTTSDGTQYAINASSGTLDSITTASGNTTHFTNGSLYTITTNSNGQIGSIKDNATGQTVSYAYDTNDNLISVTDPGGDTTQYSYNANHQLIGIVDANGVTVLSATYDPSSGQLTSLINTNNQAAPVRTGQFNGTTGSQTVVDAEGNATEDIYDAYGNVVRKIQTITDTNGDITGYLVTVSTYGYFQTQNDDAATTGVDLLNTMIGQTTYAPFEITGTDLAGLRYTQQPTTPPQQITNYYNWGGDDGQLSDPDLSHVKDEMSLIGPATTSGDWLYNDTEYGSYTALGQPTTTSQFIATTDVNGNILSKVEISSTSSGYDSAGNLTSSTDATGVVTNYTYTSGISGVPNGLLLDTYRSSSTASGGEVLLSSNTYYSATDASTGALAGELESTTTYNYEIQSGSLMTLSSTTYDVYDTMGNVLMTYTPKSWTTNSATAETDFIASITQYDLDGRSIATFQATYLGATLDFNVQSLTGTTGQVVVTNSIYDDAMQSAGGTALQTSSTTYTPDGQTSTSTDQYGGVTTNTYDASGHLIQTQYPDGTETISVYDALGRVILATDKFVPGQADPIQATRTIYDSLGQTIATQRLSGVAITIATDPSYTAISAITAVSGAGLINSNPLDPAEGTWSVDLSGNWALNAAAPAYYSQSQTIYNALDQVAETDSPTGLRTGTTYYPNGSVEYTGPLSPTASATWYLSADPTGSFLLDPATGRREYTTFIYDQVDTLTADAGEPWYGLIYNETIQNDGHTATGAPAATITRTFQDSSGRTVFTVYDDGSFTQTLYSAGDMPISGYTENSANTSVAGVLPTIPAGGSETVNIAQRKSTDLVYATIDVYDASGNLVDVYEPPVADALHSNAMTNPHTHYDYDPSGNEVDQIDAKGNETFWTYDENGNEVSRTLPDGETETYTYNQYGQVAKHTDFDGNVANYNYFATGIHAGMLSSVAYNAPSGSTKTNETVSYTYDSLGRTYMITDASGGTTDYYDAQGNLDEQQTPEGTIWYTFNASTGEHTDTYTAYTHTVYGYNPQGELTSVTVTMLNGSPVSLSTYYTYDGAGNKLSEILPDGELTTYTYDDLNRLIDMVEQQGTTTLFSESLTLNDNGTPATAAENQLQSDNTTVVTTNTTWGYDAMDRLLSEAVTSSISAQSYTDTYSYDLNGNQITKVHTTSAGTETTTNTYNGDNELTQSVDSSTGTTTFGYDANGSQTSSTNGGNVTTDTYDVRNRLASVTTGGVTTTYGYDDAGNRVSETTAGTTTYYLIDSNNLTGYAKPIEQWVSTTGNRSTATLSMSYVIGDRVLAQVNGSGVVSYLLIDGQDNTRALSNSSGAVTATFNYSAFGDVLGATYTLSSPPPTIFLFQQMMFDTASGLNFTESRQTPMGSAYWIERDSPVYSDDTNPITLNFYLLDGANPISNIDFNGHSYATQFGTAVHNEIAEDFRLKVGKFGITFKSIFTIVKVPYSAAIGTLLPDLVYYDPGVKKEVFEIKPDNVRQIIAGYAQLAAYVIALNKIDPAGGWTVGSYSTYIAPVEVTTTDPVGFAIVTQLPGGLITYTSFQDYAKQRAERTAEAEGAEEEGDLYQAILDNLLGGV